MFCIQGEDDFPQYELSVLRTCCKNNSRRGSEKSPYSLTCFAHTHIHTLTLCRDVLHRLRCCTGRLQDHHGHVRRATDKHPRHELRDGPECGHVLRGCLPHGRQAEEEIHALQLIQEQEVTVELIMPSALMD